MKVKLTQKQARNFVKMAFSYCEIQYLLLYEDPSFYTSGTYGRKEDIYHIEGYGYITTGYSPCISYTKGSYELCKEYDNKAHGLGREERRTLLLELLGKLEKIKNM